MIDSIDDVLVGVAAYLLALPVAGAIVYTGGTTFCAGLSGVQRIAYNPDQLSFKELYNNNWQKYMEIKDQKEPSNP